MPQAFKQAPWRLQILNTSRTAFWIVGLLVLGGIYLAVNSKVASAGRELLVLERRHEDLVRLNSELGSIYAELSAPEVMMEHAAFLGFRSARPDEVEYLIVEGLPSRSGFVAPLPASQDRERQSMLSPSYTETLGDWLDRLVGRVAETGLDTEVGGPNP